MMNSILRLWLTIIIWGVVLPVIAEFLFHFFNFSEVSFAFYALWFIIVTTFATYLFNRNRRLK
jgi:uncharacterized membrane protein YccC